jgi:hypothetical protein
VPQPPALRAFADGFVGSLAGGLVYCMILAYCNSPDLQIAGLRVLALSLTLGAFEMWRAGAQRPRRTVARCMFWTLGASLFVFWAVGVAYSNEPTNDFDLNTPPIYLQIRLDPVA